MDEKKIIQIAVDNDAAIQEIIRLREEVTKLATAENLSTEEQEAAKVATKEYNDQIRSLQKEVQNSIKTDQQKTGSLQQMKAQLSNLTKEYNNLSKEERESAKGTELRDKIKGLSDELKENETAVGNNYRSVGNYGSALDGLKGKLDMLPTSLAGFKDGLKGVATGFIGVIKQMWLMVANPIGAVIAAVALVFMGLYNLFKDFDPVVDAIQVGLAALGAIFKSLKDTVFSVVTGQKSLKEAFEDSGRAMSSAAKAAMEMKRAQQELDDMQWKATVNQEKYKNQIDELILQSKNRTLTEAERIAMIEKALEVEAKAFEEKKAMADKSLLIAQNEIISSHNLTEAQVADLKARGVEAAIALKDTKRVLDEQVKTLADALAEQHRIENESIKIREKAMNRRDQLEDAAAKQAEARKAKQEKDEETRRAKEAKEEDKRQSDMDKRADEEIKRIDAVARKYEEWAARQKAAIEEGQKSIQDAMAADAKAIDEGSQKFIEAADMVRNARAAVRELEKKDEFIFLQQQLDEEYAIKIAAVKKENMDTAAIEAEYRLKSQQLNAMKLDAQLQVLSQFIGNIGSLFEKGTQAQKAAASAGALVDGVISGFKAFNVAAYGSGIPVPYNFIAGGLAAAGVAAATTKTIKDIWAVPNSGRGSVPKQTQTAPSFNIPDTSSRIGSVMSGSVQGVGAFGGSVGITSGAATSVSTSGNDMMRAMQNMPAPVVTVKDIDIAQKRVTVVDNLSKI